MAGGMLKCLTGTVISLRECSRLYGEDWNCCGRSRVRQYIGIDLPALPHPGLLQVIYPANLDPYVILPESVNIHPDIS